ncbi:MAG: hypothetical protein B6244_03715 [Candidatus Cloacimonetes bacterium 4572_55]|nr:MAG: hypothetical protein B6244_03715 [Candidatus Cloacimonetes bacterium 4572_55]
MNKVLDHFIHLCFVSETDFAPALTYYDNIIANPPGLVDSVFAVIDAGVVYLKMTEEDSTASPQSLAGICPVSFVDFQSDRNRLLAQIGLNLSFGESDAPEQTVNIPEAYGLDQNYPNPFNPMTTIRYQLPLAGHVDLKVYNTAGQLVRTLADHEESAGFKSVQWDGRNDHGAQVASGLYFYRLETEDYQQTRRMLLLK